MSIARIRAALVLLLMAASFLAAAAWRPTGKLADHRPKVDLESLFPKTFGNWMIDDRMPVQLVSPDAAALLSKLYNQTLSRTYINPKGERIMLSVAYGGDQSDATRAHRPEVCYPSQGFQLVASSVGALNLKPQLNVRRLVAKLGGRIEPITYWIMVGEKSTVTGTEQKLAQLSYSTRGLVPDGMLIRVSSIDSNSSTAFNLHERFIQDMVPAIQPALLPRVVGLAQSL